MQKPNYIALERLEGEEVNKYQVCVITGMEARNINSKIKAGTLEAKVKSTTLALEKFMDGKVKFKTEPVEDQEQPMTF